jgi:hypothetical protein
MLGRKDFTREKTDAAKAAVGLQLSTFRKLPDPGELEPVFFNAAAGVLRDNTVIKYVPTNSVLDLKVGDRIALAPDQFERLAAAVFAELAEKFA